MNEMIHHIAGVITPVLLCVAIGYGLALLALPFDNKVIGTLVSNVGYPTLILSHLTKQHILLGPFLEMMLAAVAAIVLFGLIGFAILSLLRLPIRGFLSPMMLNNVGNVGLPVCALAFGDQGLAYAMAFVVVVLVGVFTFGIWLPKGEFSASDLLRQPVIYAAALAIVMMATDARLPKPIDQTFTILGGIAIPLMLLTLGHTLATLNAGMLRRGSVLALLHLMTAGVIAYALTQVFALSATARGVLILQCLMPVSVATYLWIERYDSEDAPAVASFILISTLLSIAVLPLALTFWI